MSLDDLAGRIAPCVNCGHDPAQPVTGQDVPESSGPPDKAGGHDRGGPHGPTRLHDGTGLLDKLGRHPPSTTFGGPISPAEARRMACDARITPVVLGGKGEILDVGRSRYSFPTGIRKALEARDRGCAFPGCDRPPGWTEAHHVHPFSKGGETKLSSAVLVCDHHHHLLHHSDWQVRIAGDGIPEFLPPR
ncbi:HNH endonuclease, partial [Nakamurella silvestris]